MKRNHGLDGARPRAVRWSISLWVCAVAAGVGETLVQVARTALGALPPDGLAVQVLMRVLVYTAVLLLVLRLRRGERAVRLAVAVLVGGVGTLSMIGQPIIAVAQGVAWSDAWLDGSGAWAWTFAALRAVHVVAVLGGLVLLFVPASNGFFRPRVTGVRATG